MNLQPFSKLLARHPQIKEYIEQDNFLVGYSGGGQRGQHLPVFLLNSPWREYCLEARAIEVIPSGGVLVVSLDDPWRVNGTWQAYYWDASFVPIPRSTQGSQSPKLTHLATRISLQSVRETIHRKTAYSSKKA